MIPTEYLPEYEQKLRIVNLRNEGADQVSIRYLSKQPRTEDSVPAVPRLEDLYLWLFPQDTLEREG